MYPVSKRKKNSLHVYILAEAILSGLPSSITAEVTVKLKFLQIYILKNQHIICIIYENSVYFA